VSSAGLLVKLAHSHGAGQLELIAALAETKDEHAFEALAPLSERATPDVAGAALRAIATIGGERARLWLEQRLAEARDGEQPQFAEALATLGGAEARATLLRAAQSSARAGTRHAALSALSGLDSEDVRVWMLQELGGPAPESAVQYFSDCVEPRALPALEVLVRTSEAELREQAALALVAQGEAAQATLARLLSAELETADAVLSAAKGVLSLRPTLRAASIARLREGALTTGAVFDYLAEDLGLVALQALMEAARDEGSASSAISAIARRGDPPSLRALGALSRDENTEIATQALCAQFRNPDSRARPALLGAESDATREAVAAALLSIDAPEADGAVTRLTQSDDDGQRRTAAQLLGRFGSPSAERQLERLARDSDYGVAVSAVRALARTGASETLRRLANDTAIPEQLREHVASLLGRDDVGEPRHEVTLR
jgi:HEAT repeat protein